MKMNLTIGLLGIAVIIALSTIRLRRYQPVPTELTPIILSNVDTIYKEIEILTLKQDTIKIYYEKKIHTYNVLPTTDRIQLFADRVNR